jgi:hypothetical protein
MAAGVLVLAASGTGAAQTPAKTQAQADLIRSRQQISTMAAVIDQAIKHGVERMMTQFSNLMLDRPRLSGPAQISGVRIDDYGILFHVQVPQVKLPILWDMFAQDLQARDTRTATMLLQQFRAMASGMPPGRERAQIESNISQLQQEVDLGNVRPNVPRGAVSAASLVPVGAAGVPRSDAPTTQAEPSVLDDPMGAYRREVTEALVESMLESTQPFHLKPDEWFTIIARGGAQTDPLSPGDAIDTSTWVLRVKGSVLAQFHSGSLTLDEARKLVEVKEQ